MSTIADRRDRATVPVRDISPEPDVTRPSRRGHLAWAVLLICLVPVVAWCVVERERPAASTGPATAAPAFPPVPVSIADVARRDFPIALRRIGSVQAYNAVIVKS